MEAVGAAGAVAEEKSGATEEAVGLRAAGAVAEEDSVATEESVGAAGAAPD